MRTREHGALGDSRRYIPSRHITTVPLEMASSPSKYHVTTNKENSHFISLQLTYFVYLQGNKQHFYGKYNRQKTRNSRVE